MVKITENEIKKSFMAPYRLSICVNWRVW